MLREKIINAIQLLGFDEYREINSTDIVFEEYVFDSCKVNSCGNYGANHACPPLSGDLEANRQRFLNYDHAIILNKILFLGDYYEKMASSLNEFNGLLDQLQVMLADEKVMIAGPGGCHRCPECSAKTAEPCRFPDQKSYSMEGSGMEIVAMVRNLGMTYNTGDKKVGFFMIVMY